ncbi:hypothetical protein [Pedobacter africanus]|uniref:Uncharacterized protein n=1 Tax=Pedobacter africanus TaxID=151894 RepID=A0A1W2CR09_9SPHI|nr:hypothetical protein [Pedobacter africanus]SMC87641.1 hypothetical protein SAMN04488524_3126 [Pedobacter africanus]
MKSKTTKKEETSKPGRAIRFSTTPAYYFHPDEDFKEDYDWGKNRMLSKSERKNTGESTLRS